jgi:hypothetical protein
MTAMQRRALLTDPASYPGQRLADPRPKQSREDLIRHYQMRPIPGQLALFTTAPYVPHPRALLFASLA